MNSEIVRGVILAALAGAFAGCIHHESTTYKDVERIKVEFENDRAARLFYEALEQKKGTGSKEESTTRVDIPVVFHQKQKVVTGPNWLFNDSVLKADTNKDGKITEAEARIFNHQVLRK